MPSSSPLQSSKSSLDRYYSVASVFKCEHFKSIDRRLNNRRDESSNDHSNSGYASAPPFCQSACFCSATSRAVASGTIGTTMSKSTSTEIPTSSYSPVDTSTSNFSSSETESRLYIDAMEDSDASYYDTANNSADGVVGSSNNRINVGVAVTKNTCKSKAISSESSYTTVTLEDLSEEFFTDTALEKEKHRKNFPRADPAKLCTARCDNVGCDVRCNHVRCSNVGYDNTNIGCGNTIGCDNVRCNNVGHNNVGSVGVLGNLASMNVVKSDVENEDDCINKCDSVDFPQMPLLRRSSSTSELVAGPLKRYSTALNSYQYSTTAQYTFKNIASPMTIQGRQKCQPGHEGNPNTVAITHTAVTCLFAKLYFFVWPLFQ